MLSKIATSIDNLNIDESRAAAAIREILNTSSDTGIADIYAERFEVRYDERKIRLNVDSIYEYLHWSIEHDETEFGTPLIDRLKELKALINKILSN